MNRARAAICVLLLCTSASLAQTPPTPTPTPTPTPAPTPTPPPAPTPRFNSGSPLDGIRNQAWSKLEEMTDAYEQCDAERYERALNELEQLRKDARAAAAAARGAGEFRTVNPEEADSLANSLADMVRQYAGALAGLKRECTKGHRPGGVGTILGPRRQPATGTHPPAQGQGQTGSTATQPPPNPQPPNCNPPPAPPPTQPPPEPVESILDEIEEMERWERERKKAEREKRQASGQGAQSTTPAQGLTPGDEAALARQLTTIESFEAALAELKELVRQGRMNEAWDLIDELDEWLDELSGPPRITPAGLSRPRLPKELIDKWDDQIEDIIDSFPPGLPGLKLGTISATILDLHNKARAEAGVAPLRWDPYLACQAISYGPTLAQYDRPVHSPRTGRETSRENLLQALPGTSPAAMMNVWISEQRHFRPGVFPDVSSTGNWADVGHYTQMVWPKTTAVGCGVQRGIGRFDWLICRYSPPGNKDGTAMGLPPPGGPVIAQDGGVAAPDSSTPIFPRGRWKPPVGGE